MNATTQANATAHTWAGCFQTLGAALIGELRLGADAGAEGVGRHADGIPFGIREVGDVRGERGAQHVEPAVELLQPLFGRGHDAHARVVRWMPRATRPASSSWCTSR